jgi:D-lactate dehydrogenase (quinone)
MSRRADFAAELRSVAGTRAVLTDAGVTRPYRFGYRKGGGAAFAVVRPKTLGVLWRVLQHCVDQGAIVIPQAANTGLTGGSTPWGDHYDGPVVIINMMDVDGIHVIRGGQQVICLPGATLHGLEKRLRPYGREPHSLIGSSCLGASVVGGICNNSGGTLLQRGPAYTEMSLFAQLTETGTLQLINHLGIRLGDTPEEIIGRLERAEYVPEDVEHAGSRQASDQDYCHRIRQIDSDVPLRFNADPRRLYEASGCAGRIVVFAVRLDTFPIPKKTQVFYIGTRDPDELTQLRRHMLSRFAHLPVSAEYLHRDAFDIAERYGKDTFLAIKFLGTERLPAFFRLKGWFDARGWRTDGILQAISRLFPSHLPERLRAFRDQFDHHLILTTADDGIVEATEYLQSVFPSTFGNALACTPDEGNKALLHRFAAAGAAIRYRTQHSDQVEDLVALDIALKANDGCWREVLPEPLLKQLECVLYYGHFFCHVFHQDYLLRKGADVEAFEQAILSSLDARGAEYPAEHNVGHLYRAKPPLAAFYRSLDPCNRFNPGIGHGR